LAEHGPWSEHGCFHGQIAAVHAFDGTLVALPMMKVLDLYEWYLKI
jgi:hypothetical protein